jgi:hypothetical protein
VRGRISRRRNRLIGELRKADARFTRLGRMRRTLLFSL